MSSTESQGEPIVTSRVIKSATRRLASVPRVGGRASQDIALGDDADHAADCIAGLARWIRRRPANRSCCWTSICTTSSSVAVWRDRVDRVPLGVKNLTRDSWSPLLFGLKRMNARAPGRGQEIGRLKVNACRMVQTHLPAGWRRSRLEHNARPRPLSKCNLRAISRASHGISRSQIAKREIGRRIVSLDRQRAGLPTQTLPRVVVGRPRSVQSLTW